ncbi:hypothetical protein V1281_004954 [Nitrobacteraceae bacterium AZCC 2161]
MPNVQDDDFVSRKVDRVEYDKRIAHDWKRPCASFVRQLSHMRELFELLGQSFDASDHRPRSASVAFGNIQENIFSSMSAVFDQRTFINDSG